MKYTHSMGQVEANVKLQAIAPEDTEFYVVLQGHDLAEVVSVTSYIYAENRVKPCEGEASLEYLRDVAQEAAEYLSAHRDHLGTQSYLEVLERFPVWVQAADEEYSAGVLDQDEGDEDDLQVRESRSEDAGLLQLDEKITQAMANMDYPPQWKNTDSQQREDLPFH
ncbi:putative rho guanine nucleotide exchange factor 28-like [Scophthalmus maximus]|uniref:Putative rho guanine nucleotide exchange factor 28-like n=1 Tax=Scophthalmus maximus TaxID=52904 RepID=A0A2U9BA62_SCOMX|nr:putative rho guanine nucleotide exchange factor 28-like [Scophthalmus maximus]